VRAGETVLIAGMLPRFRAGLGWCDNAFYCIWTSRYVL
jgi:hypothetical protein